MCEKTGAEKMYLDERNRNDYDQVGVNNINSQHIMSLSNLKSISCGHFHTVAFKSDGSLWAWGRNRYGQLGISGWGIRGVYTWDGKLDYNSLTRNTPMQLPEVDWASISCGYLHTLAIKCDGSLWAWGWNKFGQLGLYHRNIFIENPKQIGMDTDWTSVSCGADHTVAIKSDGSLWAWGSNYSGQLGEGMPTKLYQPTQIGQDTDWASISCGNSHTVAIKRDGSLWSWGMNDVGQLGDGTNITKGAITRIGTENDWSIITCGKAHNCAFKSDGSLWAWGAGNRIPIRISTDKDWSSISCGRNQIFVIKSDGSLWSWGSGNSNPLQIGIDKDWVSIACGLSHTVAIKSDGSLWAWGENKYGQLGDGIILGISSCIPIRVGWDKDWKTNSFKANNTNAVIVDSVQFVSGIDKKVNGEQFNINSISNQLNNMQSISFINNSWQQVKVFIYDSNGDKVKTLLNEYLNQGEYTFNWDGTNEQLEKLPSGVYFYFIKTDSQSQTGEMRKVN